MSELSVFFGMLTLAFGCWAGVIGYFAHGIRSDVRAIAKNLAAEAEKLNLYIVQTETRLAVLESKTGIRNL